MSVVVALRYKNGIALAADKQVTWGNMKQSTATKIVKTKYSNLGMGAVGSGRLADLLEVMDEVVAAEDIIKNTPIDRKYMIKHIVPDIFEFLKKFGILLHDDDGLNYIDGSMIFVTPDTIQAMASDGGLVEYEDFASIGCGRDLVYGYLSTLDKDFNKLKEDDAIKIIITAIQKACKDDAFIDDNIDILLIER